MMRLTPLAQNIYSGALAMALCAGVGYALASAVTDDADTPVPSFKTPLTATLLPPCEEEDSPSCVWDAGQAGNGIGHSFYADASNTVHYIDSGVDVYVLSDGTYVVSTVETR